MAHDVEASSGSGAREVRTCVGRDDGGAYVHSVLVSMSKSGFSRVTATDLQSVIVLIGYFGITALSSDPDVHRIYWLLRDGKWARVSDDEITLFALSILDVL